jgi:hypothetical protein
VDALAPLKAERKGEGLATSSGAAGVRRSGASVGMPDKVLAPIRVKYVVKLRNRV